MSTFAKKYPFYITAATMKNLLQKSEAHRTMTLIQRKLAEFNRQQHWGVVK
jgi:hypothetical protein